jgi:hypothetical protein
METTAGGPPPLAKCTITFWKNGFSVDDGKCVEHVLWSFPSLFCNRVWQTKRTIVLLGY